MHLPIVHPNHLQHPLRYINYQFGLQIEYKICLLFLPIIFLENFYPYSKLLKIGIHELAHVMSKGYDPEHKTPEFISNYSYLMNKAHELGYKVE